MLNLLLAFENHLDIGFARRMDKLELAAQRFGRLRVTEWHRSRRGGMQWSCQCDCGAQKWVRASHLKQGAVQSCGCLGKETTLKGRNLKHGCARNGKETSEYGIWSSMQDRCRNSNNPFYKYYGGRGISVCERWRDSFENFLIDMGPKPPRFSIERINNAENYCPQNCKWASALEQNKNRRLL
jgi:hypothetical protein